MLIICDFDGTVTVGDTNVLITRHHAISDLDRTESQLANRSATVREVLAADMATITDDQEAVLATAATIEMRPGFTEFVARAKASGHAFILLSSGFREVINAVLAHNGASDIAPLLANSITFTDEGGQITWRDIPTCDQCGEACKLHDIQRLQREHAQGNSGELPEVVFIGDGYSDRCGADIADHIFAVRGMVLAKYLRERDIKYQEFDDFYDIATALDLALD